jgi:UDP-N-acetylglucosamine enolpyruvyl transferase
MLRKTTCSAAALIVAGSFHIASAQTTTAPATSDAKPSHVKLTMEKLKEMKAKWVANRPKMKACRAEMKAKGLHGDDRWFFMADCMSKT